MLFERSKKEERMKVTNGKTKQIREQCRSEDKCRPRTMGEKKSVEWNDDDRRGSKTKKTNSERRDGVGGDHQRSSKGISSELSYDEHVDLFAFPPSFVCLMDTLE